MKPRILHIPKILPQALQKNYPYVRLSGLLFIILTIIGFARAFQHFYVVDVFERIQYGLWWHIPFNLFLWWIWFLFVPVMLWTSRRIPVETFKALYWLVVCFFLPMVIIIVRQAIAAWISTMVLADKSDFYALFSWRLLSNQWIWLDVFVYFAILIGIQVIEYQRRTEDDELRLIHLQTQLAQSQLNALESQLHPHFLFNTLNTISTLILKADNVEAERMLGLLKSFLKTTVYESGRHEITMEEELRFINLYLEIEKVRFKDKLEVNIDIADDTRHARVPTCLLQPIVENAVHYAIAPKTTKGLIGVTSRKENGQLSIRVEDNGPGIGDTKSLKLKKGVGLKITKERLIHLFGEQHLFVLGDSPLGGLQVTIRIPFVTTEPSHSVS
jgi:two-component system, LytTR family, sensor kinase